MAVSIDGYPLDLVETEAHELVAEVTDHPVEDGSDVSDNVRLKPRELTFTNGIVSDTPIGAIATDTTRGDISGTYSQDAYNRLENIWLARQPVTVVTRLKKYENMILDRLSINDDSKTSHALVFTAHFKQVTIVKNKRVTVAVANLLGGQNLGGKGGHVHPANVTYVQSANPASAAAMIQKFGQPVLRTTADERAKTNGNRFDGFGVLDHYAVPEGTPIDGYVSENSPKINPNFNGHTKLPPGLTGKTKFFYRLYGKAAIPGYPSTGTDSDTRKGKAKHQKGDDSSGLENFWADTTGNNDNDQNDKWWLNNGNGAGGSE